MTQQTMPPRLLPLKPLPQEQPTGCLAACAQMLLAYLNIPSQQRQLSQLLGQTDMGARFTHLTRLTQYGVRVTLQQGDETQLVKAINQGHPAITFVTTGELTSYWQESVQHAVVVIGYDERHLYLNDPAFPAAPKQVLLDEFMLAWIELDCTYALITR